MRRFRGNVCSRGIRRMRRGKLRAEAEIASWRLAHVSVALVAIRHRRLAPRKNAYHRHGKRKKCETPKTRVSIEHAAEHLRRFSHTS